MGNEFVEKHLYGRERAPVGFEVGCEHAVLEVRKGSSTASILAFDGSIPTPPAESELMRVILDTADFYGLTLSARVSSDDPSKMSTEALVGFYLRSGFKQVGYYSDMPETSDFFVKANDGDIKYVMVRKPVLDNS